MSSLLHTMYSDLSCHKSTFNCFIDEILGQLGSFVHTNLYATLECYDGDPVIKHSWQENLVIWQGWLLLQFEPMLLIRLELVGISG